MELSMNNIHMIEVFDNPEMNFAHNIYLDQDLGTLYIERVWDCAGVTIVNSNGETQNISLEEFKVVYNE